MVSFSVGGNLRSLNEEKKTKEKKMKMKHSLLHYTEKPNEEVGLSSPSLLRTVFRPLSHCSLFDLRVETEHTWPSSNLLNGSGHYHTQYHNGAHLVVSNNRLLVVRDGGHFFCSPWDSPIHDTYIEPYRMNKHSLLFVGLSSGIYLALLQEGGESPLTIVEDIFVGTNHPVKKIFILKHGEAAVCYGNAEVEAYQVLVEGQKVNLIPRRRQRPLQFLQTVTSLWRGKQYRNSAYNSSNGMLFVLSSTDLTLWTSTTSGVFFAVCSVPVQGNTMTVLSGLEAPNHATLVLADGGRQSVFVEETDISLSGETRAVLRLGSIRPLTPDVRIENVQLACQSMDGTTLLYDTRSCTLVMVSATSPICEGIFDLVEVVSTLRVSEKVVGVVCITEPEDPRAYFVVYGQTGIIYRIGVRPLGFMMADLLQQGSDDMTLSALHGLGGRRGMEALAGAAFAGTSMKSLPPLLNELLQPSFRGNTMIPAPGVYGLISLVRREIAFGHRLWSAPFSWRLAHDLKRVAAQIQRWHQVLEGLLRPFGWLDSPAPVDVSWDALVANSRHPFTMRRALDAQALLLSTLLNGLRNAGLLCWLHALFVDFKQAVIITASNHPRLEIAVWGDETDGFITRLCMEVLDCCDADTLDQLEKRKIDFPKAARHVISIYRFIFSNQPVAALSYACENIRSLRNEEVWEYVGDTLGRAFPEHVPHLRMFLCLLKHNRSAMGRLPEMLEVLTKDQPPERIKLCLGLSMRAAADDPSLQSVVLHWMENHPLDDSRLMAFAEVLEEHGVILDDPHTLTAMFFVCWARRIHNPALASRGFGEISRSNQRIPLLSRILCVRLALEDGATKTEHLAYFLMLLQEELADAIDAAWCSEGSGATLRDSKRQQKAMTDVDELRYFYVGEDRLFELAGEYRKEGGAKVQLDVLKVHPETPEEVTVEVLYNLLMFLVDEGMSATEAVRNVVREYYDGYAAGLPLLPFVIFLSRHGEDAEEIAALLQSSGVPPHAVFDMFLLCLEERIEDLPFAKGTLATILATTVTKLSGESRSLCAAYLLKRIHNLLSGDHGVTLMHDSDMVQLRLAEATLLRPISVSPTPLTPARVKEEVTSAAD